MWENLGGCGLFSTDHIFQFTLTDHSVPVLVATNYLDDTFPWKDQRQQQQQFIVLRLNWNVHSITNHQNSREFVRVHQEQYQQWLTGWLAGWSPWAQSEPRSGLSAWPTVKPIWCGEQRQWLKQNMLTRNRYGN